MTGKALPLVTIAQICQAKSVELQNTYADPNYYPAHFAFAAKDLALLFSLLDQVIAHIQDEA